MTVTPRMTPRLTRLTRLTGLTRLTLLTLTAVLSLTACSQDKLGAAAVIDGRTITTAELQSTTRDYLAVVSGGDAGDAQIAVLQRMIVSAVIDEAAREAGVNVPQGRVAAERDSVLKSVGGRKDLVRELAQSQQTVLAPSDIDRWVKDRLLFNAIAVELGGGDLDPNAPETQEALSRANEVLRGASEGMDIEISPRYGSWDPAKGISPLVSGGLSKTAAQLAGE